MKFIHLFFTVLPVLVYTQDITDAVNWSIENESGNARYSAMGGAFGALGEHFLSSKLSIENLKIFSTAVDYHQLYSVLLLFLDPSGVPRVF